MKNFDITQLRTALHALGVNSIEAFEALLTMKRRLEDEEIQRVELVICGEIVAVTAHSLSGEIVVTKTLAWRPAGATYTYEVEPCRIVLNNGSDGERVEMERCKPEEAESWAVYRRPIRQPGETAPTLAEWLSDHPGQAQAEAEARRLRDLDR